MLGQRRFGKVQTALLVIIALVFGVSLISPAVGHVKKSLKHLYKHLDPRYVNVGEKATSAATADSAANADKLDNIDSAQFVQNQGSIKIAVNKPWKVWPGPITISDNFFGFNDFSSAGANANQRVILIPDIPVTLYGRSLQLTGMQLCYNATNANVVLDEVALLRSAANNANTINSNFVVNDTTDRNDNTCRTYSGTPQVMAPNAFATVELTVDWLGAGGFTVSRTTLFVEPTASETAPLRQISADTTHRA